MKFAVLFVCLFSSVFAWAGQRVFDCKAQNIPTVQELPEEYSLKSNPVVIFREAKQDWSLQVGDYSVRNNDAKGPATTYEAELSKDLSKVAYFFQIDGSLEFQLVVSTVNHKATLFWWGLGEPTVVAKLSCEVIEQE